MLHCFTRIGGLANCEEEIGSLTDAIATDDGPVEVDVGELADPSNIVERKYRVFSSLCNDHAYVLSFTRISITNNYAIV